MSVPSTLIDSFKNVPINRQLGFKLISRSSESAVIEMDPKAELLQEEGIIHGAIVAALADTAAVYTFHPDLPSEMSMTSIEFKLNFLAPALGNGGRLSARSLVVKKGKKVGVCDVEVTQGERLVAKGLFTYLFFPRRA